MGLLALRRYLPYMRPYIGLVVVFGIAQLGSLAASAAIPKVIQGIIDGPITHHQLGAMVPMAGLLVAIGVLEFVFIYLRRNYSGVASLRMETDLRNDFYAHLQNLQVAFHDNWQSGQLLSRAISDIATVRRFVSFGLIWFLQTIVTFAVVFVLMLNLDWQLALVVVACMLPIAYFSNKFHDKYKVIARRLQDQQGDLTTIIEEMATGVRIIKAFGRVPLMAEAIRGPGPPPPRHEPHRHRGTSTAVDPAQLPAQPLASGGAAVGRHQRRAGPAHDRRPRRIHELRVHAHVADGRHRLGPFDE
ncbi:MAG TPA: ABC transporter ATP-binding protein, partial [Candidatus Dormibacteraeota bacterium]